MKPSLLTLAIIFCCRSLFAQNENPYAQFGYQAAIMPEQSQPKMESRVDRLFIINQDSTDAVAIVALDAINRNITFYDKNRHVLKVDTLTNYTLARWISPDPYGQFSSPYLGMGNNPVSGVDPDGGFSFVGAALGTAAGVGLSFALGDQDHWYYYAAGGFVAGGLLGEVAHSSHGTDWQKANGWDNFTLKFGEGTNYNGSYSNFKRFQYTKSTFTTIKDVPWLAATTNSARTAVVNGLDPKAKHTIEVELGGTGRLTIQNTAGKSATPNEINPKGNKDSGRNLGILKPAEFYTSKLPTGSTGVKVTLGHPLTINGDEHHGMAFNSLTHRDEILNQIKIRLKSVHNTFRRKTF